MDELLRRKLKIHRHEGPPVPQGRVPASSLPQEWLSPTEGNHPLHEEGRLGVTVSPCEHARICGATRATPVVRFSPPLPALLRDTIHHGGGHSEQLAASSFAIFAVDLETTGFSPVTDEIVEIALAEIRWNGWEDCDDGRGSPPTLRGQWIRGSRLFHSLVRPSVPIGEGATLVHGLTATALQDAPTWEVVAAQLAHFFCSLRCPAEGSSSTRRVMQLQQRHGMAGTSQEAGVLVLPPLVAHNARFDAAFLESSLQRVGYRVVWDAKYPLTCTGRLMRLLYPQQPANLDAACHFFGITGVATRQCSPHSALTDVLLCTRLFLRLAEVGGQAA